MTTKTQYFLILLFACTVVACGTAEKTETRKSGFKLVSVKPGSVYDRMGLKAGDILTEFNGKKLSSADEAMGLYEALSRREDVVVKLKRDGKIQQIKYPKPTNKDATAALSALGLKKGDVIKEVNGEKISSPREAMSLVEKHRDSANLELKVLRAGKLKTLKLSTSDGQ